MKYEILFNNKQCIFNFDNFVDNSKIKKEQYSNRQSKLKIKFKQKTKAKSRNRKRRKIKQN